MPLVTAEAMFCDSAKLAINAPKDGRGISQKQDDMFLIAGKCGTLIRRDKGAGSRLTQNARKS